MRRAHLAGIIAAALLTCACPAGALFAVAGLGAIPSPDPTWRVSATAPGTPVAAGLESPSPSPSVPGIAATRVPAKPTTGKPTAKTPAQAPKPPPKTTAGGAGDVHPGAFCSPAGAHGTANGKTYTCKGPDPLRWRP